MSSTNLQEKLKETLKQIFQLEEEDLDFGIYRIINYKRKEIENFIEKELIEEVKTQLELISAEEQKELEEELKKISSKSGVKKYLEALEKGDKERAKIYREDFADEIAEYERLKKQIEQINTARNLEKEIYNHLIEFFSRYYKDGDFISQRRYGRKEKYCIPYNGEEVYLYWANKDQYYIKTTEYLRKYVFKIDNKLKVVFKLINIQDEVANAKPNGQRFFLHKEQPYDFNEKNNELTINFEYRHPTEEEEEKYKKGNTKAVQEEINKDIVKTLKEKIPQNSPARLIFEKDPKSKDGKSYIEKHLRNFTKRNTTDYFIHKNLKEFLTRELDFYIKNEFLQLEDLDILDKSGYFDKLRLYLIGVRAFRRVALKVIEFLSQLENFQKRLWEKKKFVISTHYVITLDRIEKYAGEEFLKSVLSEILNNEKQLKEWKELFGLEVKSEEDLKDEKGNWKKLPIDTRYFDENFKWKLICEVSKNRNLDDILDGILIKSENWQALNLLLGKYREKVKTIYIDPPYNTGNDEFLYKDSYQHSSWLTMMENRLLVAKKILSSKGVIAISIDNTSVHSLRNLMDHLFGSENYIMQVVWHSKYTVSNDVKFISQQHEYLLLYAKLISKLEPFSLPRTEEMNQRYSNPDNDPRGPWKATPLHAKSGSIHQYREFVFPNGFKWICPPGRFPRYSKEKLLELFYENRIYFPSKGKEPVVKTFLKDVQEKGRKIGSIWKYEEFGHTHEANEEVSNILEKGIFSNPKPTKLVSKLIQLTNKSNCSIILDFFAGSGTTAHAVMKLNKEDGGNRKFILVEISDYFYTVIIPRIKKIAYSFNWKEGKPQDMDGLGVFFKYHTLEQYEDALENIEFKKFEELDEKQREFLYSLPDYFVKYMLDFETKGSNTLLNNENLADPFNYKLKVYENYELKTVNVDVVETFNYLFGVKVNRYKTLEENGRKYIFVFGEKDNKKVAIVWRSLKELDYVKDRDIIEREIKEYAPDELYINGDAIVCGYKAIEPTFRKLMFEEVG